MFTDDTVLLFFTINKVVQDNLNLVAQSMESNKLILNQ